MPRNMIGSLRKIPLVNRGDKRDLNDTITKINKSMGASYNVGESPVENGNGTVISIELENDTDNIKIEGLDMQRHHYAMDLLIFNNSGSPAFYHLYCGEDYTPANYEHNRIFRVAGGAAVNGEDGDAPLVANSQSGADNYTFAYINFDITRKGRFYYFSNNGNDAGSIQVIQGHGHTLLQDAISVHLMATNSATGGTSVVAFGQDTRIQIIQLA